MSVTAAAVFLYVVGSADYLLDACAMTIVIFVSRSWRGAVVGALGAVVLLVFGLLLVVGLLNALIPLALLRLIIGLALVCIGAPYLLRFVAHAGGLLRVLAVQEVLETAEAALASQDRLAPPHWSPYAALTFWTLLPNTIGIAFVLAAVGTLTNVGVLLVWALIGIVLVALIAFLNPHVHVSTTLVGELFSGAALGSLGAFFLGEGFGIAWPGKDLFLLVFVAAYLVITVGLLAVCKSGRMSGPARRAVLWSVRPGSLPARFGAHRIPWLRYTPLASSEASTERWTPQNRSAESISVPRAETPHRAAATTPPQTTGIADDMNDANDAKEIRAGAGENYETTNQSAGIGQRTAPDVPAHASLRATSRSTLETGSNEGVSTSGLFELPQAVHAYVEAESMDAARRLLDAWQDLLLTDDALEVLHRIVASMRRTAQTAEQWHAVRQGALRLRILRAACADSIDAAWEPTIAQAHAETQALHFLMNTSTWPATHTVLREWQHVLTTDTALEQLRDMSLEAHRAGDARGIDLVDRHLRLVEDTRALGVPDAWQRFVRHLQGFHE